MPILTPPQLFGCSKQQLSGHSDKCYSSHDGIVHLEEKPDNGIEKVGTSKKIDIEHFYRVLAAFRFFQINPPLEFLRESNSLEEKYIKPVLWFREHFLLPPFPSPRQVKYNIQEIPENSTTEIRFYLADSPENSKDHLLMIFVPPGTICWSDFASVAKFFQCPATYKLMEQMGRTMKTTEILVLTDEIHLAFFRNIAVDGNCTDFVVYRSICLSEQYSIRLVIGAALYGLDGKPDYPTPFQFVLQGVMNHRYEPIQSSSTEGWERITPIPFRHFDYFTLQRSLPAFTDFLLWKREESSRLCSQLLDIGTTFKVDINSFRRNQPHLQSFFPLQPLPKETVDAFTHSFHPRNESIDGFLTRKQGTFFRVTEIIRRKPDSYSQAFVGVLCTEDGLESPPLFLKLFVEGLFPVNENSLLSEFNEESYGFVENASRRLRPLNFADDMLRREEFAYTRLRAFQGMLLPHCYGIHAFTLDGILSAYGLLLEVIPGLPFSKVHFEDWETRCKASFIRQLRHCLRVLLYAGIEQQDVHEDQILLPQGKNYGKDTGTIVFIDFAFAPPRLGDEQADKIIAGYVGGSWGKMKRIFNRFGIKDIIREEWTPLDLEEL